jgi:hypothetical protein
VDSRLRGIKSGDLRTSISRLTKADEVKQFRYATAMAEQGERIRAESLPMNTEMSCALMKSCTQQRSRKLSPHGQLRARYRTSRVSNITSSLLNFHRTSSAFTGLSVISTVHCHCETMLWSHKLRNAINTLDARADLTHEVAHLIFQYPETLHGRRAENASSAQDQAIYFTQCA